MLKKLYDDVVMPGPCGDDEEDPPYEYEIVDPDDLPLPRALPLSDDSHRENKDSGSVGTPGNEEHGEYEEVQANPIIQESSIAAHSENAQDVYDDVVMPGPGGDDDEDPQYELVYPDDLPLSNDSHRENKDSSSAGATDIEEHGTYDEVRVKPTSASKASSSAMDLPHNIPENREKINEIIAKMLVGASTPASSETAIPPSVSQEAAELYISPEELQTMEEIYEKIGRVLNKSVSASPPVIPEITVPPSISPHLHTNGQQRAALTDVPTDSDYIEMAESPAIITSTSSNTKSSLTTAQESSESTNSLSEVGPISSSQELPKELAARQQDSILQMPINEYENYQNLKGLTHHKFNEQTFKQKPPVPTPRTFRAGKPNSAEGTNSKDDPLSKPGMFMYFTLLQNIFLIFLPNVP